MGTLDCIRYMGDTDFCIDHLQHTEADFIVEEMGAFEEDGAALLITVTRRVPVEGKSSVCLICMKYRIIILIIIIISLGQILLSYIANTSRTHAPCQRTRAHACASTHTAVATAVQVSAIHRRPPVTARSAGIHSP